MSTYPNMPPVARIVERGIATVTVIFPYCGQKHKHLRRKAYTAAICMRGDYYVGNP